MTRDEFMQKEVIREDGVAKIIIDTFRGRPVRLYRFSADIDLSDYEVLELGYRYYKALEWYAKSRQRE